jgi:hypothetical protein
MILFPKVPQKFVSIMDHVTGNIEIPESGVSVPYRRGVYLADKHKAILSFQFENGEVGGPAPDKMILSPEDVVIPEEMLPKTPKIPKAPKAPVSGDAVDGGTEA